MEVEQGKEGVQGREVQSERIENLENVKIAEENSNTEVMDGNDNISLTERTGGEVKTEEEIVMDIKEEEEMEEDLIKEEVKEEVKEVQLEHMDSTESTTSTSSKMVVEDITPGDGGRGGGAPSGGGGGAPGGGGGGVPGGGGGGAQGGSDGAKCGGEESALAAGVKDMRIDTPDTPSSIYQVKWVVWGESRSPIITQNENGPCPLISIVNVLLLRGRLGLPEGCQVVSAGQLLEWLADLLLDIREGEGARPDLQHNVNDAIAVLPRLATGLDVNVRFTGVSDFEYTEELIIFDLLHIPLLHGWLVDPEAREVGVAVNTLSYNQLVETVIRDKDSSDSVAVGRALVAEQWLEDSRSQLTYHGLCELSTALQQGQLAVFFRNNHFSTLYSTGGELFLLVTDQGFLDQPKVVWETLGNIEGDTVFVDHQFHQGKEAGGEASDHRLALALGRQEEQARHRDQEWEEYKEQLGSPGELTDAQLAARLQEAENQAAAEEARQGDRQTQGEAQPGPSNPIGPRRPPKKEKDCCIL